MDPLSAIIRAGVFVVELWSGHNDLVQTEGLRFLNAVPDFPIIRWEVAISFVNGRRPKDAISVLRGLSEEAATIAGLACRFLRLGLEGQPEDAKACFDSDLLSRARNVEFWSFWVSECYAFINETDLAIEWLETAFRKGYWNYLYVSRHSTVFRKFDGDPRFQAVLSGMKAAWEQFEP